MKPCSHDGCRQNVKNRSATGLCVIHYQMRRRELAAIRARACHICGDGLQGSNKARVCKHHHRPSMRRCADCGKYLSKNTKGKFCADHLRARSAQNQVPPDRLDDFFYLAQRLGTARAAADHILAGKPVERKMISRAVTITAKEVVERVSEELRVSPTDILGAARFAQFVRARACTAMILRNAGMSLPRIGQRIGRDHTSVRNLLRRFPAYAARDPRLSRLVRRFAA